MHPIPHSTPERIRESYYTITSNLSKYENMEDVTVIWLDSRLNVSLDCFDTQIRLRRMIDHLFTFNSNDAFLEYFNSEIQPEQIFLIVSGKDGEFVVPQIHSSPRISSIYIFCNNISKHEQWTKDFTKMRGIFNSKDDLLKKLAADIMMFLTNLLPIKILAKNDVIQKSLYDLTHEGARSMWFQLLIEALVQMEHSDNAKRDLLEICRQQYKNDIPAQKKIDKFERIYKPEEAVWWYTADSFLYRLLNKALRTENIDIIYKFRLFLTDLDHQIRELHKEQLASLKPKETFYRGQKIPTAELINLQKNIDNFIAINAFTSVSKSIAVPMLFAGDGEDRPTLESVIFQIEIDTSISPCANIEALSSFPDEEEMLMTIGSVFRIVNVEPFYNRWIVDLALNKSDNQQMEELTNYLKIELLNKSPLLDLARILFEISDYNRAEQYCIIADKELSLDNNDRTHLYQLLGEIYQSGKGDYKRAKEMYEKALSYSDIDSQLAAQNLLGLLENEMGNYDAALKTLETAEALCCKHDLSDHNIISKLVNIYTNKGIVYRHQSDIAKSLQSYNQALDLNLQIRPVLHPSLATLYNNIGYLNCVKWDYDVSLEAYEKALNIQLQALPKIHKDLATVYNNIGIIYMATSKFTEALENYEKSLNMFKELLEADHPTIATLHHNIGDTYRSLKQYDKAVYYLEKALELRMHKLSPTHAHIGESWESLGWVYYRLSYYEKALVFCKKTIEIAPDNAAAYHCMGMIFDLQCNYDSALSSLQKAIDLYKNFPAKRNIMLAAVHKAIAIILTIQEKPNQALEHYNKAIEEYHSGKVSNAMIFIEIHTARGFFFCRTGRYDEALEDLYEALNMAKNAKENLSLPSIFVHIGNIHLKQHHFDEALKYFQDAEEKETLLPSKQYSMKGERLHLLANLLYQQKDYEAALQNYESALQVFYESSPPNTLLIAHIHIDIGRMHEQLRLYDKSLIAFQEALRLVTMIFTSTHPTIANLYYRIARIQKMQGLHRVALQTFNTALNYWLVTIPIDYAELADIYDNLADIVNERMDIEETDRFCDQSLKIRLEHNPCDAFVSYVNMGRLKCNQKRYSEAETLLQKAVNVYDPNSPLASSYCVGKIYIDLALVYNINQKYDEAMETISMAIETKRPDDMQTDLLIIYTRAYIHQMQNQYEVALDYYKKILVAPHSAVDDDILTETYMRMVSIYYNQKQFRLALEHCEKCLDYKSKSVPLAAVYESMAGIYVSLGQEDESAKLDCDKKTLNVFMKMLELCSSDDKKLSEIHGMIANLYLQLNETDLSIKHNELRRDHLLNTSPMDYNGLLVVYEALIDSYTQRDNRQKVIENCELALNIYMTDAYGQVDKELKNASILCHKISTLYCESENIGKAIEYMEKALQLQLNTELSISEYDNQVKLWIADTYLNLSTLYKNFGDIEKQIVNLENSLDMYRKITDIPDNTEILLLTTQICKDLSDCYGKINNSLLQDKYRQEAFICQTRFGSTDETKVFEYKDDLEKIQTLDINKDD